MMLFDTLDTIEKAREFRNERIEKINNGKALGTMNEVPYCILHWLPISKKVSFEPSLLNSVEFSEFMLMQGEVVEPPTSDGFRFALIAPTKGGGNRFFWNVHLFRSGALEMAFVLPLYEKTKDINPKTLTENLRNAIDKFKEYTSSFGTDIPVVVRISFLNVLGYSFFIDLHPQFYSGNSDIPPRSNKKEIILPEKLIESLQNMKEDVHTILDTLWKSFGYDRCPYYNEDGTWKNLNE